MIGALDAATSSTARPSPLISPPAAPSSLLLVMLNENFNRNLVFSIHLSRLGATMASSSGEEAIGFSSGGFSNYFARPSYQSSAVSAYKTFIILLKKFTNIYCFIKFTINAKIKVSEGRECSSSQVLQQFWTWISRHCLCWS